MFTLVYVLIVPVTAMFTLCLGNIMKRATTDHVADLSNDGSEEGAPGRSHLHPALVELPASDDSKGSTRSIDGDSGGEGPAMLLGVEQDAEGGAGDGSGLGVGVGGLVAMRVKASTSDSDAQGSPLSKVGPDRMVRVTKDLVEERDVRSLLRARREDFALAAPKLSHRRKLARAGHKQISHV